MALMNVDEALGRILAQTPKLVPEQTSISIPLAQAGGRIVARDVRAQVTQPPFAASAMDGYAFAGDETIKQGATLAIIGEVAAGRVFTKQVSMGQCVRIFTGAPVPENCDRVIIQEDTNIIPAHRVEIIRVPDKGANIRPMGGDFSQGDVVLKTGQQLNPAKLALAAAAGYGEIDVMRPPRVGILSTGDELVGAGQKPNLEQIVASNAYAVSEIVCLYGGQVHDLGLVGDEKEALAEAIERARLAQVDILVTIGGASVGDYDLVQQALRAASMQLDFWKIAMRPGKPLMFGQLPAISHADNDQIAVLGLPGNPVSAIVTAHLFLVPMLEKMQGLAHSFTLRSAHLKMDLPKNGPRRHYLRGKIEMEGNGKLWVAPAHSADSSLLSVLADSDCLIVVEANAAALKAGSVVEIFVPPHGL